MYSAYLVEIIWIFYFIVANAITWSLIAGCKQYRSVYTCHYDGGFYIFFQHIYSGGFTLL